MASSHPTTYTGRMSLHLAASCPPLQQAAVLCLDFAQSWARLLCEAVQHCEAKSTILNSSHPRWNFSILPKVWGPSCSVRSGQRVYLGPWTERYKEHISIRYVSVVNAFIVLGGGKRRSWADVASGLISACQSTCWARVRARVCINACWRSWPACWPKSVRSVCRVRSE